MVVVSQAYRNGVDLTLYESGAAALAEGAIGGGDMTPSAALVKLMQGLAYHSAPEALRPLHPDPDCGGADGGPARRAPCPSPGGGRRGDHGR